MGNLGKDILDAVSDVQRAAYKSGLVEGRKQGEATNAVLLEVLKQIITDLPTNRDWLSPDLEREAKQLIKEAEAL